jgi:hypothetical protein
MLTMMRDRWGVGKVEGSVAIVIAPALAARLKILPDHHAACRRPCRWMRNRHFASDSSLVTWWTGFRHGFQHVVGQSVHISLRVLRSGGLTKEAGKLHGSGRYWLLGEHGVDVANPRGQVLLRPRLRDEAFVGIGKRQQLRHLQHCLRLQSRLPLINIVPFREFIVFLLFLFLFLVSAVCARATAGAIAVLAALSFIALITASVVTSAIAASVLPLSSSCATTATANGASIFAATA